MNKHLGFASLCLLVIIIPIPAADDSFEGLRDRIGKQMDFELTECPDEVGSQGFRNSVRWCGVSGLDFPQFQERWKHACRKIYPLRRDTTQDWEQPGAGIQRARFYYWHSPGYVLFAEDGGVAIFILSTGLASCEDAGFGNRKESGLYATRDTPGIRFPKKIIDAELEYPATARMDRREGRIVLEGIVTTDGRVNGLCVLDASHGDPDLRLAAAECVQNWVYEPAVLDDEPVDFYTVIQVSFDLN